MNDNIDPYKTPTVELSREDDIKSYQDAEDVGLGFRFIHYIVDLLMAIIISIIFSAAAYLIWDESVVDKIINSIPDYIFGILLMSPYYILMEGTFGRTVGKYLTKCIVVTEDGKKIKYSHAIIRTLSRFIPFEPLSFFGKSHRGWHDRFSNTRVVKINRG